MAKLDDFFRAMVARGASDLHVTAGEAPRVRVDGSMEELESAVLDRDAVSDLLKEIAPRSAWEEFLETRDTDFAYPLDGVGRFRANYFRDMTGPGAVFRVIPSEILSAQKLGLPPSVLDLCGLNKGLVLVTGPTGSGKSTTLAAMIDHINATRADHIITIEDPVEFVHPNKRCLVNQREIGTHTQSFASALRAALREDPDIILCGELRDKETVHIALEMAETGHLVFGTLHTNTAASTVDRIIDQFPSDQQPQIRTMLAGSLKGVIAQTLLKKRGGGRVAALEILLCTGAVAANIREGRTHQIVMAMQTGGKLGMVELNRALLKLVQDGLVDPAEALQKAIDRQSLERDLQRHGLLTVSDEASGEGTPPAEADDAAFSPHGPQPGAGGQAPSANLDTAEPPTAQPLRRPGAAFPAGGRIVEGSIGRPAQTARPAGSARPGGAGRHEPTTERAQERPAPSIRSAPTQPSFSARREDAEAPKKKSRWFQ